MSVFEKKLLPGSVLQQKVYEQDGLCLGIDGDLLPNPEDPVI